MNEWGQPTLEERISDEEMLRRFAPWSISKSDLAGKCTKAFSKKYIEKVYGVKGADAKVGTAAHRVQELILKGTAPNDALEAAFTEKDGTNLTTEEQYRVRELLEALIDYERRISEFKAGNIIVDEFFERELAVDFDGKPCDYHDKERCLQRGLVDHGIIMQTPNGAHVLLVIDHKTGRVKPIADHLKQLQVYAVLAAANFPRVAAVRGGIHYPKAKQLDWDRTILRKEIERLLFPWMKELLTSRAGRLNVIQAQPTNMCKWCDYYMGCEEGQAEIARLAAEKEAREAAKKQENAYISQVKKEARAYETEQRRAAKAAEKEAERERKRLEKEAERAARPPKAKKTKPAEIATVDATAKAVVR